MIWALAWHFLRVFVNRIWITVDDFFRFSRIIQKKKRFTASTSKSSPTLHRICQVTNSIPILESIVDDFIVCCEWHTTMAQHTRTHQCEVDAHLFLFVADHCVFYRCFHPKCEYVVRMHLTCSRFSPFFFFFEHFSIWKIWCSSI